MRRARDLSSGWALVENKLNRMLVLVAEHRDATSYGSLRGELNMNGLKLEAGICAKVAPLYNCMLSSNGVTDALPSETNLNAPYDQQASKFDDCTVTTANPNNMGIVKVVTLLYKISLLKGEPGFIAPPPLAPGSAISRSISDAQRMLRAGRGEGAGGVYCSVQWARRCRTDDTCRWFRG
ncbi:unnamed protein product [Chrysodeixis includens]|uniref:Uncharacterized protein n=1 Tax=Chrysodeixis includens TaxID=689277 RepID=A0A9N8KNY6_CHRIL|nr:unnamed protein product [Chrysodeixis includens]